MSMDVTITGAKGALVGWEKPAKSKDQEDKVRTIERKISSLQKEMETVKDDRRLPVERREDRRKDIQNELRDLNEQLRKSRDQEREAEEEKRKEEAKGRTEASAASPAAQRGKAVRTVAQKEGASKEKEAEGDERVLGGSKASGAVFTTSQSRRQLNAMRRIRDSLEGRLRTARSREEKQDIRKKLTNISKDIGKKIQETNEEIQESRLSDEERRRKKAMRQETVRDQMKKTILVDEEGSRVSVSRKGSEDAQALLWTGAGVVVS